MSSTLRSRARSATGAAREVRWAIWASRGRNSASSARQLSTTSCRLAIVRELGDRRGEGAVLWNLALARNALGDSSEALRCARISLDLLRQTEHPLKARVLYWLRRRGVDTGEVETGDQP